MRPDGIVLASPGFGQNLCLLQCIKYLAVEELIAQAGVEAFNRAVLPRAAWRDISRLSANGSDPRLDRLGDELRPVIRPDMCRHAAQDEEIRKNVDDVVRIQPSRYPDRQRLAGEFIDDVEHPDFAAIIQSTKSTLCCHGKQNLPADLRGRRLSITHNLHADHYAEFDIRQP